MTVTHIGVPLWQFKTEYHASDDALKKLLLGGRALLQLKDVPSLFIKERMASFISAECARLGVVDKTATFMNA
jgi:hypothetical protein